jgi:hypothetical protein
MISKKNFSIYRNIVFFYHQYASGRDEIHSFVREFVFPFIKSIFPGQDQLNMLTFSSTISSSKNSLEMI